MKTTYALPVLVALLCLTTAPSVVVAAPAPIVDAAPAPVSTLIADAAPAPVTAPVVTVVAAPAPPAAPAPAASGIRRGIDQVFEVLLYAFGLLLSGLVAKLLLAIEKKFKVGVPDAAEVYLQHLIDKGTAYAAEQSHKVSAAAAQKLAGHEKLDIAADFVVDMATKYKVQEMGKDKLKKLIEARINTKRAAG